MKNVAGEYIPRISCLGNVFLPSEHPLRIHLGDILPENSVPFLCPGNGTLFATTWGSRIAIGKAPPRRRRRGQSGQVNQGRVEWGSALGVSGPRMAIGKAPPLRSQPRARKGRSQQQCHHRAVGPGRAGDSISNNANTKSVPGASAPTRDTTTGTANPRRARLASGTFLSPEQERLVREGYSPFSVLALRAFSMICVGESKSSVLALPGATHSSRCLTTMPMFST